jgi:hypothetical protein
MAPDTPTPTPTPTAAAAAPEPDTAKSADSLLFTMAGAMFLVTVLASGLIVQGSTGWLFAAFGGLAAIVVVVWLFVTRFIDAEQH